MTDQPILRVVAGGEPTAEEVAALVVALATHAHVDQPVPTPSAWLNRRGSLRRPLPHGVDAWRLSARPGVR